LLLNTAVEVRPTQGYGLNLDAARLRPTPAPWLLEGAAGGGKMREVDRKNFFLKRGGFQVNIFSKKEQFSGNMGGGIL